jgi:SOS response regulatory protein OraA/RecX
MSPRLRTWTDEGGEGSGDRRPPTEARLHTEAVRALARRELTSLQLRERLVAAGGRAADIDAVLARLAADGAVDDRRAARIHAQTAFRVRKRTRARILQELERFGITAAVALEVVDEVCGGETERRRLDSAVIHGLRGTLRPTRDQQARRLFESLVRKGYDADEVRQALVRAGIDTPLDV